MTPRHRSHPDDGGYTLPIAMAALLLVGMAASVLLLSATARSRGIAEEAHLTQQRYLRQANVIRVDEMLAAADAAPSAALADLMPDSLATPPQSGWQPAAGDARWRVVKVEPITFTNPSILGAAERESVEVTLQWATGCTLNYVMSAGDDPSEYCDVVGSTSRRYERRSFLQYQLHYARHDIPAPRWCEGDLICVGSGGTVVFADGDDLDGPIHTNLPSIQYCGAPEFHAVEIAGTPVATSLVPVPGCTGTPTLSGSPMTYSDLTEGVALDVATLPGAGSPQCGIETTWLDEGLSLANVSAAAVDLSTLADGDIVTSVSGSDDISVSGAAPGSVTVVVRGNITVTGDISAPPSEVVALVAGCDVILDPNGSSVAPSLVKGTHDLTLRNVAVLAPAGGMWSKAWALGHGLDPACSLPTPPASCATNPNTPVEFAFEGAVASRHLGLFGRIGPPASGWVKKFSYPSYFWQVRPPWWPALHRGNWVPL